tara:strand:- start:1109 stop:1732 length:624 start_codon:yes stop_codon:yes gene_type:complete
LRKNKISKSWIFKQHKDIYVKKSKIEGYRSRAVYKLQEIDNKFKIFKNGTSVLDLGAAPGSWSQFAAKKVKKGKILSIDIKEMDKIENTFQIKGDFTENHNQQKIKKYFGGRVDIVLSDMAVNTSGNKSLDSIVTGELSIKAMIFAEEILKLNGKFVTKFFMGSAFNEINSEAKKYFREINIFKPLASRKNSKETFIICKFLRKYYK